jgi:hypothetical protein
MLNRIVAIHGKRAATVAQLRTHVGKPVPAS